MSPAPTGVPATSPSCAPAWAGQAAGERRARSHDLGADPAEALVGEHAEADGPEVALVPAALVSEIGPLWM